MYSGYEVAFDGGDSWSFGNALAWNVVIFGVDNSSSSHVDIRKNKFLVLGGGPTSDINRSFGVLKKNFSINFTKTKTKFCLSLHCNGDKKYLQIEKKIYKFKADNKSVKFPTQFSLGNIANAFGAAESREVSLKGNAYYFLFDYNTIDISDILNIHKYLMVKKIWNNVLAY